MKKGSFMNHFLTLAQGICV